jgi:16S rRNA (uracil1498-N3)-methyltransferase
MSSKSSKEAKRRAPLEPGEMPAAGRIGELFELPERVSHYLGDVLRMQPGQHVDLFDGSGRVIQAELVDAGSDSSADAIRVRIRGDRMAVEGESPCAITLVQAMPKGKRFELVLEKATELGVARIIPLETARTVVQLKKSKVASKLERWERIVEGAARQSRRNVTPELSAPMTPDEAVEALGDIPSFVAHTGPDLPALAGALETSAGPEAAQSNEYPAVALWVGPEGGFDDAEMDFLLENDALAFHLGPRVLRSETAGLVGISLLQAYLGDLA